MHLYVLPLRFLIAFWWFLTVNYIFTCFTSLCFIDLSFRDRIGLFSARTDACCLWVSRISAVILRSGLPTILGVYSRSSSNSLGIFHPYRQLDIKQAFATRVSASHPLSAFFNLSSNLLIVLFFLSIIPHLLWHLYGLVLNFINRSSCAARIGSTLNSSSAYMASLYRSFIAISILCL